MSNKKNTNINKFFNKLYRSFPNIKSNIDNSHDLLNNDEVKDLKKITYVYTTKDSSKWFAKRQKEDQEIFLFGKIKKDIPQPALFILTFDVFSIYSDKNNGIINTKQVYINSKYFIENYPGFKTELNETSIDIFVNSVPNKIDVIKLGEYIENMDNLLNNLDILLNELEKYEDSITLIKDISKVDEHQTPKTNEKNCEICGKKLKRHEKNLCKKCSRKRHASNLLIRLLDHVEPETPFRKDDLNNIFSSDAEINDCIWSLEDFNLIKQKNNEYLLVEKSTLEKFITKYGLLEDKPIEETPKKEEPKKLNKKCSICKKTLSISKFYKSKKTKDGLEDYCKNCKRYVNTANYLKELTEEIAPGNKFKVADLNNNFKNPLEFTGRLWELQDFDLLTYDEDEDVYTLKDSDICQNFLDKYYISDSATIKPKVKHEEENELTKEEQMNIVIDSILDGKSEKEAAELAGINLYKITHWFNEGKNNSGKENIEFYKRYTDAKKQSIDSMKNFYTIESFNNKPDLTIADTLRKQQMENVLKEIGSGSSLKTAAFNSNITYETLQYWYKRGKQNFGEEYNEFYEKLNILQSPIDAPKPKEKKEQSQEIENEYENTPYEHILDPVSSKLRNSFKGVKESKTGFAWVFKGYNNWRYNKYINNKTITIQRQNIFDLYLEVKNRKLPWGVRDLEKAKQSLSRCEPNYETNEYNKQTENKELNLPDEYKHILDPLPAEYRKRFRKPNSSGFAWIKKVNNNWQYFNQLHNITLYNTTLFELYLEVKEKNLPWGVRDLNKAKKTLEECHLQETLDDKIEISYETIKNEKDIFSHILNPLPAKYLKRLKSSGTATGFSWVYFGNNAWIYTKNTKNGRITISRSNLYNLYLDVIKQNLPWGVRNLEKAEESLSKCEKPRIKHNISNEENIDVDKLSEVNCIYFKENSNLKIIVNGLIKNDEFMDTLYKFNQYENNIKKIVSNRHTQHTELFIELELNNDEFKTFREKIKLFGWKMIN